jgi:HEAT repeat protein
MKKIIILVLITICINPIFANEPELTDDYLEAVFARAATIIIKYKDTQKQAFDEYVSFGAKGVPYLLSQTKTNSAPELHAIRKIIKEMGDVAIPVLIDALDDSVKVVVSQSAYMLGESASPDAIEPLRKLLNHENSGVRMNAVRGLGKTGNVDLIPDFQLALNDSAMVVRKQVAGSIRDFAYGDVRHLFVKCYEDNEFEVRQAANGSLSKIFKSNPDEIIDDIDSYNDFGKKEIIRLIGTTKDKKYHKIIKQFLNSSNDPLHIEAWVTMNKILPEKIEKYKKRYSCRFEGVL